MQWRLLCRASHVDNKKFKHISAPSLQSLMGDSCMLHQHFCETQMNEGTTVQQRHNKVIHPSLRGLAVSLAHFAPPPV